MRKYPVTQNGRPDGRYSVTLEHCGHDRPHYVARFCGDWIGSSFSYSAAAVMAIGHNQVRMGAAIVEAKG